VFRNLIDNARSFSPKTGEVRVSLAHAKGLAQVIVDDDGPGIPEEIREKLFRPFATGREGGIGLGLTFVQRVVYEHQGRIHVDSEPGRGACFRIDLPSDGDLA